jgi:hypothetical protein
MGAHWTQLKDGQEEMAVGTIVVSVGETVTVMLGREKFIHVEKSTKRKQCMECGMLNQRIQQRAIHLIMANQFIR